MYSELGKKHIFPVQLFLFFQNMQLCYWTSKVVKNNHVVSFWPSHTLEALSWIFKLETQLAPSFLIDSGALDTSSYVGKNFELGKFWKKHTRVVFHIVHLYHIKFKITICSTNNGSSNTFSNAYKNANWLEREMSEMLGIYFVGKVDGRNLLLDYANMSQPLNKSYTTSDDVEYVYSVFNEELAFIDIPVSEL